jgi:thiamine biosynthesis lipoprotein
MKRRAQPWLGTLVEISIADRLGTDALNAAFDAAFDCIANVHCLMSFHNPASDISRINHAATGAVVRVDPHTVNVIRAALAITTASGGIFDIACAPKLVEWGYLPRPTGNLPPFDGRSAPIGSEPATENPAQNPAQNPPQQSSLTVPPATEFTSGLRLESDCMVRKLAPSWIDLGGIAKGYAVDLAIDCLQQTGIRSACVNAGGDLRVLGTKPYTINIRASGAPGRTGLQVPLQDGALATSGIYFSQKMLNNRRYSALVDARSGEAVLDDFSASVRAPSCMQADALTKVVMATANPRHPALQQFDATAFIIP